MSLFLQGIRVLDLSQYIPGPFATRQLALWGADVIKIEPPQGDPMRFFMNAESTKSSPIYHYLNQNKRIIRLDLKKDSGRQVLLNLLTDADVLLESFRPGVMARLGFGRSVLEDINPHLVHCALSGFGQTGPYWDRAGHDLTYCAVGGQLSLPKSATAEQKPEIVFPPLADHAGAMQATQAILAALVARGRTGKGAFLDISLAEAALAWQYLKLADQQGTIYQWLSGQAACYNLYQTQDQRWLAVAPLETKFWQAFCEAVAHKEWIARQFEPLPQTDLIHTIQQVIASKPLLYWTAIFSEVDCCVEPVPELDEVLGHAQYQNRLDKSLPQALDEFVSPTIAWLSPTTS
ncbi:MAG: CoA transferase [Thiofilum sp.]|uniref:CaiB/BaiF CoA transferase family protein n=1 Tax=Thiofilum sp. TaxID=2212733 RepID=UPI0025F9BBBF|nr:CoA transferase [Thiofilum sp.]MBK8452968.1 CoA transferase [Thiofilum sp.]